jgi:hypothetical protein
MPLFVHWVAPAGEQGPPPSPAASVVASEASSAWAPFAPSPAASVTVASKGTASLPTSSVESTVASELASFSTSP